MLAVGRLHPALLLLVTWMKFNTMSWDSGADLHGGVRTRPKCGGRFTHRRLKNILPLVLFISPNKLFVVFDYKKCYDNIMIQLLFNSNQCINQKYEAYCLRCANLPHSPLHLSNVDLMLGQRRRRWPNINTALDQCLVWVVSCYQFSGYINAVNLYLIDYC